MALNPNIPLQAQGVQAPNLLQMMQQAEQNKALADDRRLRKRRSDYTSRIGDLMQAGQGTAPMNVEQANRHVMGEFPMLGQAGLDQEMARQSLSRQEQARQDEARRKKLAYDTSIIGSSAKTFLNQTAREKSAQRQQYANWLRSQEVDVPEFFDSIDNEYGVEQDRWLQNYANQFEAMQPGGKDPAARWMQLDDGTWVQGSRTAGDTELIPGQVGGEIAKGKPQWKIEEIGGNKYRVNVLTGEKVFLGKSQADKLAKDKGAIEERKTKLAEKKAKQDEKKAKREEKVFAQKQRKMARASASGIRKLERKNSLIRELIDDPNLKNATGWYTYFPTKRGSKVAGIEAKMKTLKAKSAISALNEMKQYSASGASGMGALSERELDVLIDAYTTIQTTQSYEDLIEHLEVIEESTDDLIEYMKEDGSYKLWQDMRSGKNPSSSPLDMSNNPKTDPLGIFSQPEGTK